MSAQIIDGNAVAHSVRVEISQRVNCLASLGAHPGLAVVLVGDNPASEVYVRNKVKDCEAVGIRSRLIKLGARTSESELLDQIEELNADRAIHGILVQLPLPPQIDEHRVIETIAPQKDVDGFHVSNVGSLVTGTPLFRPCTPFGVMKLLAAYGTPIDGTEAVVIGRSNIVGKPQALMLMAAGATVTICHSRTQDLAAHTRRADILVAAAGQRQLVTADMIKPGAVVIDVGMNRGPDGKLCGDVDFAPASQIAGAITPVPGGVGPMTRAMLLVNTVDAAERHIGSDSNDV